MGEERRDRLRARRQRRNAFAAAPLPEHGEVAPVGGARRRCLLGAGERRGGFEIGGRQGDGGLLDHEGRKGGHLIPQNC
jgi:hypothetical protein